MEAKLKDGSILYVDAEERIYAQGIPGGPFPLVIDQAEGERLLIEFAEQQKQEIELLTNLKNTLEEANRGMSAKLDEQREKIEILNGTVIRKNAEIVVLMDSYQGKGS
ncbi:hypothetical protein [Cytobacillus pseudoceanisediminis]